MGTGPNRLIAKPESEQRKPGGLTVVYPEQVLGFLAPCPVSSLRGLGCQTQKVFSLLGIQILASDARSHFAIWESNREKEAAASFHA